MLILSNNPSLKSKRVLLHLKWSVLGSSLPLEHRVVNRCSGKGCLIGPLGLCNLMSDLLDTLADPDEGLDGIADLELLGTLSNLGADDEELSALLEAHQGHMPPQEDLAAQEAAVTSDAPGHQPKQKRRRQAKSKAAPVDAAEAPETRSDICRRAAQARWLLKRPAGVLPAPQGKPTALQPAVPKSLSIVLHQSERGTSDECSISLHKPLDFRVQHNEEKQIYLKLRHIASSTSIGKQLGIARSTVQRKMKLMASVIAFGCFHRFWIMMYNVVEHLKLTCVDFAAVFTS